MKTVLVADDNLFTLQSMRSTVPWREWGFEVIAWSENGVDAWEKIEKYQPDIAILDIHMPGLSGLDLATKAQTLQKKPLIIFLSAYDKFSYAKKGLRLGVFDYLLKPLDNEELKMILDKAAKRITQDSMVNKELWQKNWYEKLFMESVEGCTQSTLLLEERLHLHWNPCGYALLLIQNLKKNQQEIEKRVELDVIFQKEHIRYLCTERRTGLLVLLIFQKVRLMKDYNLNAIYLANEIVNYGKDENLHLAIGISNYEETLHDLDKMYDEAKFALESRFFLENKSVIHYQSVMSKSVRNEYILSKKLQKLYLTLERTPKEFREYLDEFVGIFENDIQYPVEYVRDIFSQIAFHISCVLNMNNTGSTCIKSMDMIQEEVKSIVGMQELSRWIQEYADYFVTYMEETSVPSSVQIRHILEYLNTHYMEHIALKDAAEKAGVSESHLCRMLKNEMGETFVNILNKIRIQHAISLMEKENDKVYEIAEKVGFNNYAYFYQVFKKITGCSPKEYLQR